MAVRFVNAAATAVMTGKCAMIAMQLTSPDFSPRPTPRGSTAANAPQRQGHGIPPAAETAEVTAQFMPLDPGVLSESIPAFFIGRNKEGFWVARDAKGRIGGIFLLATSALSFAKRNSAPTGCATIFPSERFELDLENRGNPLVAPLGSLLRLTERVWQRMTASVDRIVRPLQCWLRDRLVN
jgi:hypothetical protein